MFLKIKANKNSISHRKLICGVGINDAWYQTQPIIEGRQVKKQSYRVWEHMITRGYSERFKQKQPTYNDVTVCAEWLLFSNFDNWFDENYIDGYQLDKDIKIKGNKEYSPSACLFVSQDVNKLLTSSKSTNGDYPVGVRPNKSGKKYESYVAIDGKPKYIGVYKTVDEASKAYMSAKNNEILKKCKAYPEIKKYLLNHLHLDSNGNQI